MNPHKTIRPSLAILLLACAAFLLLAACQPADAATSLPPAPPTATQLPVQPPTSRAGGPAHPTPFGRIR